MTLFSSVKYILKPHDGAGICIAKVCGGDSFWLQIFVSLQAKTASATQDLSAELASISLSLSAIKVYELNPDSTPLSKTLRAVKSLKYAMTFAPIRSWSVRSTCDATTQHPAFEGPRALATALQMEQMLRPQRTRPTGQNPAWLRERKIRWRYTLETDLLTQAVFPSSHHGAIENCCCLLYRCIWKMG